MTTATNTGRHAADSLAMRRSPKSKTTVCRAPNIGLTVMSGPSPDLTRPDGPSRGIPKLIVPRGIDPPRAAQIPLHL